MMNSLIKISSSTISNETVQTVNARELHGFLESKQDFSTWIKNRIEQYSFVFDVDYLLHKFMEQLPSGAKQVIDYHLTISMAKELAMVERSDKGKQARQYFIECERKLHAGTVDIAQVLADPNILRNTLLGYTEKVIELEAKVQEQAPKVDVHDRLIDAAGSYTIRESAASLQIGERKLIAWLESHLWMYRRVGKGGLLAYADKRQSGYLIHKSRVVEDTNTGEDKVVEQVRITPKGLAKLANLIEPEYQLS